MRIGIVTALDVINSVYRAGPVAELAANGHEVVVSDQGEEHRDRLFRCDVVHVYRLSDPPIRRLMQELRDAGTALVFDVDDDLTAQPEATPGRWRRGGAREQRMLSDVLQVARLADVMTATTETIAASYRRHDVDPVRVVPNFLPSNYAPGPPRPRDGVVIGWVAAREHTHDLEQLGIHDVLTRVLAARPQTHVHCVGIDLGLPPERCTHEIYVPYGELVQRVTGFDVGIAPLDDIPFNRARSDVKIKEYAAAGVPWLASPVGPYVGYGEKEGGRLVADGDWENALTRLVDKGRERRKLAKRALAWGRSQTAAANRRAWEQVLEEAVQRARRREPAPRGRNVAG